MVRKWLQEAIDKDYLPAIASLENTPEGRQHAEALNQRIRQDWNKRGAKKLTQKQGLSDELRRYLKEKLSDDHWVLDYLGLTTEEYAEINDRKQGRVAERNEATRQIEDPDAIVTKAVELITGKHDWPSITAGLAVLTGRRVAEILSTAQFEKKSQWSVTFIGALKRRGEEGLEFEIPTLTTADRVIKATELLRAELPDATDLDPKTINRKYEQAVAKACDRAFADLIPTREGKDSLYTHLFRAIYSTIATFWYCPPSVNDTEFRAAIQGHYAIQKANTDELRRSLAASRHYADYEIADKEIAKYHGKRKGIKLGVGGVQPIEVFREAWERGTEPKELGERKVRSSFRIWHDDKARLDRILEPFKSAGTHQLDRFHAFLNWFEEKQSYLTQPQEKQSYLTQPQEKTIATTKVSETKPTAVEAVVIPMQTQTKAIEQSTDQVESATTAAQMIAPSSDTKIDRLIDTMEKFVEMQMALAAATKPAQTARTNRPKAVAAITIKATPSGESAEATERESHSPQIRTGAAETSERINQAIDAIMAHNDAPGRKHTEKWAIGINTLKAFAKSQEAIVGAIGGRNRKQAEVTGTRQAEVEAHHQKHQIDPNRHNYYHRGKEAVHQVVKIQ